MITINPINKSKNNKRLNNFILKKKFKKEKRYLNLLFFPFNIYLHYNKYLLLFLTIILYPKFILNRTNNKSRLLNKLNSIIISINGTGIQKILSDNFNNLPNEICYNETNCSIISNNSIDNLTNEINEISLSWNIPLTNCDNMFDGLSNITKIDFSYFDSSEVTSMRYMFRKCTLLTSIIIGDLATDKLRDMEGMFYECINLKSLDLYNFDTSSVITMRHVFHGCHSLITLNISNFNTLSVIDMEGMFSECSSLQSLDLYNFDTSSVTTMKDIFFDCKSLTVLDISNFNTLSVIDMGGMFYGCNSLLSLDVTNFITSSVLRMDGMFRDCNQLTNLDLSSFNTALVQNMKDMFGLCRKITSLNLSNFDTSSIEDMGGMFYCCNSIKFLDLNNFDTHSVINMNGMFNGCNSLEKLNINNFNISLVTNYTGIFQNCEKLNILNLYNSNFFSVDNFENMFINYINMTYCINENIKINITSPLGLLKRGKINSDTNECIQNCTNDGDYKYEYNNKCYIKCPNGTYLLSNNNNICFMNESNNYTYNNNTNYEENENKEINSEFENKIFLNETELYNQIIQISSNKQDIIYNIQNYLSEGALDELITNTVIGEKKDLLLQEKNIIYQITSSYNQKNNNYTNISSINLKECEIKIKNNYNISIEDYLLILKIDYVEEGLLIPIIEYEVYHPITKKKIDLDICKDTKIDILIPVSINEDNLFKYNSSSEYYNDLCYPYTTERGTDIILEDRKNEYINNNMTLCETNCEYNEYDSDTKKALCECSVKTNLNILSEISIDKDKLLNNFINIKNKINIYTMKCFNLVFSIEGLKTNIGSYTLLLIIFANVILVIIFKFKGLNIIYEQINIIIKIKNNNNYNHDLDKKSITVYKNGENNKIKKISKRKKEKIKTIRKKENNPPKKEYQNNNNILIKNEDSKDNYNKKMDFVNSENLYSDKRLNNNILFVTRKNIIYENMKNKNIVKINDYNDYELNNLKYKEALKIDNRGYFQYYFSLLKRKQLLIFTFYTNDDYNSKIIKISLFLFSFALYFTINTLFFNDETMHKIYEDEGSFNFIYQIPQILYSTIISTVISIIIKFLSLSEKNILNIKKEKDKENKENKKNKTIKCLNIKFFVFFLLNFLFLIFFWYYLSSFCAVYKNTQKHLIKDALLSFGLSLLYPFGINLIPGFFRIPALKTKNEDKECLYIVSKIIQIF